MSILYTLFGIPRTFDEFVDKAKKRGINKVDVVFGAYDDEGGFGGGLFKYHCFVGLMAGKIRLKLNEHTHVRSGILYQTVVAKAVLERDTLKEAIEASEKLSALGFEVTVNDKLVTEARKTVEQYNEGIQEMCQKYGVSESLAAVSNT